MTCSRHGETYLLGFPGIAVFHICPEQSLIEVFPEDPLHLAEPVRMLLDQVLPRLLFHQGRAVLHASAVILSDGLAVAFLGDTGRGKSTIAGSYHRDGAELLTDDCLLVQTGESGLLGIPAYSGLRLWPDSFDALGYDSLPELGSKTPDGKHRISIKQRETKRQSARLNALFVLGDPLEAPVDEQVFIKPLNGSQAMMAIVESAFLLDPVSPDAVQQNFALLGIISKQNTPVYSLNYQRNHQLLPKVRATVSSICSKGTQPSSAGHGPG